MRMHGNNMYEIVYIPSVIKKDLPILDAAVKYRIKRAIEERLMIDPVGFGKPLRYSFSGHRSLRVGDYRVIYSIDSVKMLVVIVAIKHRSFVYEA